MANKTYEMQMILGAVLGSGFASTFTQAQQYLSKAGAEVQRLNSLQQDISGYQSQQRAVELTTRKLEILQKQYNAIQKEIDETDKYSSALEGKLLSKEYQVINTTDALRKETETLTAMENELQEAGIDTEHLAEEQQRLAQEAEEAKEQEESFGKVGVQAAEAVGAALVAAGITAKLKEFSGWYKECVQQAADFQSTMSTVEALSGASAEEMQILTATAKELGATTAYTAQEAAEAMTYMGMAGWDAQQMISGMPGVLALAAASGEDLATVSDIVTDALTAFGMKAEDTGHFADVLAAAATNSNTSVAGMGETFKSSAALAGALGYSVEDVAIAIGLMANAGIKGSNAGTALRNMFMNLINSVTLTSESFGEIQYSAVNADGSMRSWGQTLSDLRGYFAQMSEAERVQNAQTLVGTRAMTAFVDLMNSSEDDFTSMTEAIYNCSGAAQSMADIKLDNLNGQITLMKSAWDAVKEALVESESTQLLIERLGSLSDETDKTVRTQIEMQAIIDSLNARVPGLALNYNDVANGLGSYRQQLEGLASAQRRSALKTAATQGVGDAENAAAKAQVEYTIALNKQEAAYKSLQNATDAYNNTASEEAGWVGIIRSYFDGTYAELKRASEEYNMWSDAVQEASDTYDQAQADMDDYLGILEDIDNEIPNMYENAQSTDDVIDAMTASIGELTAEYTACYAAAKEAFDGMFGLFDKAQADTTATVANAHKALESQQTYWETYAYNVNTLSSQSATDLGLTQESYNALLAYVSDGSAEAAGLAQSMVDAINSGNTKAVTDLANTVTDVQAARDQAAEAVAGMQTDINTKMAEIVKTAEDTVAELDLSEDAKKAADNLIEAYANAILEGGKDAITNAGTTADDVATDLDVSTDAATAGTNTMEAYASAITTAGADAVAAAQSVADQVSSALATAQAAASSLSTLGSTEANYATGTQYATPGIHLVGEEGPELVLFRGGEKVYDNDETRQLLTRGAAAAAKAATETPAVTPTPRGGYEHYDETAGGYGPISVTITVNGTATEETAQLIRDAGEDLVNQVIEALEDRDYDRVRRAYV